MTWLDQPKDATWIHLSKDYRAMPLRHSYDIRQRDKLIKHLSKHNSSFNSRAFPDHLESLGDSHGCDFVIPS